MFSLELLGAVDDGLPVDVGELAGLVEAGEGLPALDGGVVGLRVPFLLGRDRIDAAVQRGGLSQQRVEFALVGPAEHIPAAVVDAEPVVFLVAAAATFDLPGPGDRLGHAAELGHRLDALVPGAASQFVFQPVSERGVL